MLVDKYNFNPAEAEEMCFQVGIHKGVGIARQRKCPCPKKEGHTNKKARFHKFPDGYSFEVARQMEQQGFR